MSRYKILTAKEFEHLVRRAKMLDDKNAFALIEHIYAQNEEIRNLRKSLAHKPSPRVERAPLDPGLTIKKKIYRLAREGKAATFECRRLMGSIGMTEIQLQEYMQRKKRP